jgi:hypothetical protein
MQFGMVEVESPLGIIAKCAFVLIIIVLIVLVHHALVLRAKYVRLRRHARGLGSLFRNWIETKNWDLTISSVADAEFLRSSAVFDAVRQELPSKGPLAVAATFNQALDLMAAPLRQLVDRLWILGLGTCLLGMLGALSDIYRLFRFMALPDFPPINWLVWRLLASDVILLLYGFTVGIACLAISGLFRDRMKSLYLAISK